MVKMVRRGMIEEYLKRVFLHGPRRDYIVYIKYRTSEGEEYRPIPVEFIDDIRGGYIIVGEDKIPFHRVVEIRRRDGRIVYSRLNKKE
jgi:uncharacterized protein (UPF0248 family)